MMFKLMSCHYNLHRLCLIKRLNTEFGPANHENLVYIKLCLDFDLDNHHLQRTKYLKSFFNNFQ